jgi:hypothetical protein
MSVSAFEGIVEHGRIRLLNDAELPEHARVFVILPSRSPSESFQIPSPRFVTPDQARDFEKTVFDVEDDVAI